MNYSCWGNFDLSKAGHDEGYYQMRYANLDFRGNLSISPLSWWGFGISVFTLSHIISDGAYSPPVQIKSVKVEDYAWICSLAILYNCSIGHHAIVSIGSVVRNLSVPPYHVAEGNPAKLICYWDLEKKRWIRLDGNKGEDDEQRIHPEIG